MPEAFQSLLSSSIVLNSLAFKVMKVEGHQSHAETQQKIDKELEGVHRREINVYESQGEDFY